MDQMEIVISTAWLVLHTVGLWLLFRKAGKPGWHSLIPVLSGIQEFSICWKGGKYILFLLLVAAAGGLSAAGQDNPAFMLGALIAVLWSLVILWKQNMKLARSFGKGFGMGLFLFLFSSLGRIILGLGSAQYVGKD